MTKVGSHHADGWQKKTGQKQIHEQGQKQVRTDVKLSAKQTSQALARELHQPKSTDGASRMREQAQPQSGRDVSQPMQKQRGEMQQKAANAQTKEFVGAKRDAQQLSNLVKSPAKGAATKDAVAQKGVASEPNLGKQNAGTKNQPQVLQKNVNQAVRQQSQQVAAKHVVTQHKARATTPQAKTTKQAKQAKQLTEQPKPDGAQQARYAPRAAAQAGQAGKMGQQDGQGAVKQRSASKGEKKKGEKKSSASRGRGASATGAERAGAQRDLGALLGGGGFGGDGDEGFESFSGNASIEGDGVEGSKGLPESDPASPVFNEPSAGDAVMGRARLYGRLVEKRIQEIAQLNDEIETKIKTMFETTPLRERIVSECETLSQAVVLGSYKDIRYG